jgi:enamine deaminase RidA (YjgF/YER057c/UK114 family)
MNIFSKLRPGLPVVRPDDLVSMRIELVNLKVENRNDANLISGFSPRLIKAAGADAYIILHFPPQSFAEEAFFEVEDPTSSNNETPGIPPIRARISNESRLVFVVPNGFDIEYSLTSVLEACQGLPLKVTDAANASGLIATSNPPKPELPDARTTSIELPWRLILSPNSNARWLHAAEPLKSGKSNHIELWHTRLDAKHTRAIWAVTGQGTEAEAACDGSDPAQMTSAWIPTTELPTGFDGSRLFRTTLNDRNRFQIAHLSSNFSKSNYVPNPIETNMMMLSSLGGWLDSRGAWDPAKSGYSLEEWVHNATLGRDHYVRVVDRGYLFPFGHRVSLVTVSERKFHHDIPGNTAYLRQRQFIMIREKERAYNDLALSDTILSDDIRDKINVLMRKFPFSSIKLLTDKTPNLDKSTESPSSIARPSPGNGNYNNLMFWPHVGNEPFRFPCEAIDLDGRRVLFELPMIFMNSDIVAPSMQNGDPDFTQAAQDAIAARNEFANKTKNAKPYNTANLNWQRVALAASLKPGDTSVLAEQMEFGGFAEINNAALKACSANLTLPLWTPQVNKIKARIEAIAHFSGQQNSHMLSYNEKYLDHGFWFNENSGNQGEVFVNIEKNSGPDLDFSSQGDKSGGFVQPNLRPTALSRLIGPVMMSPAQMDSFIAGTVPEGAGFPENRSDLQNQMPGLELPLLFGCIPLGAIIAGVGNIAGNSQSMPKFISEASTAMESFVSNLSLLYSLVSNIPAQPAGIAQGALKGFDHTLSDLNAQAKAYAGFQRNQVLNVIQQVQNAIQTLQNLAQEAPNIAQELRDKIINCVTKIELFFNTATQSGLPSWEAIEMAFNNAQSALTDLENAVNAATYLPPNLKNSLINAIQQIRTLLTQVYSLVTIVRDVQKFIQDLQKALDDISAQLASFTIDALPSGIPSWDDINNAIGIARNFLAELRNAVNAQYHGLSLPADFRQSALSAIQQIDTLLTQVGELIDLIIAANGLWNALSSIFDAEGGLVALFSDAQKLETALNTLRTAINSFRTALASATLLSGAPRNTIIAALQAVEDVLKTAEDVAKLVQLLTGDELTIRYSWNPQIKNWGLRQNAPLFRANDPKGFMVAAEARVKKNGSFSPKISVICGLKKFDLILIAPLSFLELYFDKIEFSVDSAAKMDVDVVLASIKFVGPLSFVEVLRTLIPLDGFSDPPYLDISAKGIDAGYSISLPAVACGMFNLSNLSLNAGFTVPFIGNPLSVRFYFCSREQPFNLSVCCFGGGGFFGVTIDPKSVQLLEASFEFGASISVDLGVASGGVSVMAGIYYRMEGEAAMLSGYFRMGGHVNVLGLITASIELYLSLEYDFSCGKCVGRASLTIGISLFFFSIKVTISCERKFAGSNGDPTFREMMGYKPEKPLIDEINEIDSKTQYAWRDYVEAFI